MSVKTLEMILTSTKKQLVAGLLSLVEVNFPFVNYSLPQASEASRAERGEASCEGSDQGRGCEKNTTQTNKR